MKNVHTLTSAALLALAMTAHAQTIHIDGVFSSLRIGNPQNGGGGDYEPIAPIPYSFSFEIALDPTAEVITVGGELNPQSGSMQTHLDRVVQSAHYAAPRSPLFALDRMQTDTGEVLSEARFNAYAGPTYTSAETQSSFRLIYDVGPIQTNTQWIYRTYQKWQSEQAPGPDPTKLYRESWISSLGVSLIRPADYTGPDASAPMTQQDLLSFLAGFESAGGHVEVNLVAGFSQRLPDELEGTFYQYDMVGDFSLKQVSAPIPEPTTLAMTIVGLGLVASRTLRKVSK